MSHYPFNGSFKCTSKYGINRNLITDGGNFLSGAHEGMDFIPLDGDRSILAIDDGVVEKVVNDSSKGYGRYIRIAHRDGLTSSLYGHLKSTSVKKGDQVWAGQKIGVMGNTGNVKSSPGGDGSHLHLSVYDKNYGADWAKDTIDPADYLNLTYAQTNGATISGGSIQYPTHSGSGRNFGEGTSKETRSDYYSGDVQEKIQKYLSNQNIYKVTGAGSFGGYQLFGRRYSILVSDDNGNTVDVSDLSCEFEINKTAYLYLNVSTITIYNLAPKTENAILVDGAFVTVQAGYEQNDHYGTIFRGRIYQKIKRKINGTTYALDLICMSSQRFFSYAINSFSLSANQNAFDALLGSVRTTVFEGTSIDVGQVKMSDIVYPRGKVIYGQAKNTLADLSKNDSTSFYFDDETINTLDLTSLPADNEVVYLNSRSGMVGSPKEIPSNISGAGISVQCLLNPLIHLQNLIHVDNSSIQQRQYDVESGELSRRYFLDKNGLYRVVKLQHIGNTRGNDWYTNIEAVSQSGGIAGLLQSSIDSVL